MFKKLFKGKKNSADIKQEIYAELENIFPPFAVSNKSKQTETLALKNSSTHNNKIDIVSLGLISKIFIADKQAFFSITVPEEQAEQWEPIRRQAESAITNLAGIDKALVSLTAEKQTENQSSSAYYNTKPHQSSSPKTTQETEEKTSHTIVDKTNQSSQSTKPKAKKKPAPKTPIKGIKHIIAIASGKGGVGKSTVAINLAIACQKQGLKVGLMDADIYGPSLPKLTGIHKPDGKDIVKFENKKILPLEQYGLKLMSMGFLVDESAPLVWRGPMVMSAVNQMLNDVSWGELDLLIVDMPPGTGDAQLTLAQKVPLSGAIIVSTPQALALIDARKGLEMFKKVEAPLLGLIENMSYFIAPDTGKQYHIFGHPNSEGESSVAQEAKTRKVPFLGALPLDPVFGTSAETGKPVVFVHNESEAAQTYSSIASKVIASLHINGSN